METQFKPVLTIRIYSDEKCFGPGIAELLNKVDELHSLRSAAISMEMAYSKAWKIIKRAETSLGYKLLDSTIGGKQGGGASLTPEAVKLIKAYEEYRARINSYAEQQFLELFPELAK